MVYYKGKDEVHKGFISAVCIFHGCAVSDGYVYTFSGSGPDQTEYSVGDYYYISGIRSRAGGLYVLRFCEVYSTGN